MGHLTQCDYPWKWAQCESAFSPANKLRPQSDTYKLSQTHQLMFLSLRVRKARRDCGMGSVIRPGSPACSTESIP